jgi:hypothetical protein
LLAARCFRRRLSKAASSVSSCLPSPKRYHAAVLGPLLEELGNDALKLRKIIGCIFWLIQVMPVGCKEPERHATDVCDLP